MKRGVGIGLLGLLAALGAASAAYSQNAPAAPPAPAPSKRPAVRVATLSNGLRLLCRPNDASDMVSIVCLVRAGLPDEREEQAGLAALTAEALVRGTTTHPGRSFEREVVNAGGNLRAMPGFDFTEISIVANREQFEGAIKLLADVVAHPEFSAESVKNAKDALMARAQGFRDDFTGASYQTLTAKLYPHSAYGRPMNGYKQTLEALTPADVRKFWESTYVQNRIVVSLVGDFDPSKALATAQKAFQDVPFKPGAATPAPAAENLDKPRVEMLERPGPAAQLMVGYLTPPATRNTYPVYAVLDAIVGGGKRARLFQNIREKHSIGYELGSFYQPLMYQSHLVGYVVTPPQRRNPRTEQNEGVIDLVKGYLLDQYRTLTAAPPTDQELARAKAYVVGRYALRQERTRDQAKWLAWNVAMGLGVDFDQYFEQRVASVTKDEVMAAAKRSLTGYALVVTLPAGGQE